MSRFSIAFACLALAFVAGCGGDDEPETAAQATPSAAAEADLGAIKAYLLEHTARLNASVGELQRDAQAYYDLAKAADFDYAKLLQDNREEVAAAVKAIQDGHIKANPDYEEMEGVVAGVPELADYDVIIDAGADKSDPENAVPFSLETPNGRKFEQPGNFFALVETSAFGTEPKFTAKGVEADLDGDGKVTFPEALPDADFLLAATTDFAKYAKELDESAKKWEPDARGRVHGRGRDDADDVGVLRRVEELALHRRRRRRGEGLRRHLPARRHPRHPRRARPDLRQHRAGGREGRPARRPARPRPSCRSCTTSPRGSTTRSRAARSSRRPTPTRSGTEAQRRAEAIAGQVSQAAGKLNLQLED